MKAKGSIAALIFLLTLAPDVAWTQASRPSLAPLPPAAQDALNKGITAAKAPDYALAIRFFEEARKSAPQAAIVFFNLGLAEARIPGRELRAMAWFGAYRTAYPDAPNLVAVNAEVDALKLRNQGNISRLIKDVQDAANLLHDTGSLGANAQLRVALVQAANGDIAGAETTTDLIKISDPKSSALIGVAEAKIRAGDLTGARKALAAALKVASRINAEPQIEIYSPTTVQGMVREQIASAQAKADDVAGALKTAGLIIDPGRRVSAHIGIAGAQARSGDVAGARKTLASASTVVALIHDADFAANARRGIAEAQAKVADARSEPVLAVSDWLKRLDDNNENDDCALNTAPFLDLAGHLKAHQKSNWFFQEISATVQKVVDANNVVIGMLKQPATR